MIYGFDTECYIDTAELKIVGVEGLGVFYISPSTPFYFILELIRKNKMNKFCCFNLDYDAGALIKYLFPVKYYKAIHLGIRVEHKGVSIKYIPKKKLILKYKNFRIVFYDTWQFYKTSLRRASKLYLNQEKIEYNVTNIIKGRLEKDIINALHYCYIDCENCGKLFRMIYDKVEKVGIKNPELLSQGYIAYQYFKKELTEVPRVPFNNLFKNAYRGGRFEVFRKGYWKKAYYYDICSAYPFAISKLKSLLFCDTVINNRYLKNSDYSVFYCNLNIPFNQTISPIGVKINNKVIYPTGFIKNIYIDKNDYDCVIKAGGKIDIKIAYHIITEKKFIFKRKINYIYKQKLNNPNDKEIWKILLNSIYGKLLQNVKQFTKKIEKKFSAEIDDIYFDNESGDVFFKYGNKGACLNFIFASYITSHTRKQIFFDIFKNQKDIIAIFTDGIISSKKLPLPLGKEIGKYNLKIINDLYMVGSGIYFYKYDGVDYSLFRGFHVSTKEILKKILNSKRPIVNFETKQRLGLGKCIAMNNRMDFNLILPVTKQLNLNFDSKRVWLKQIKKGKDLRKQISSLSIPFI